LPEIKKSLPTDGWMDDYFTKQQPQPRVALKTITNSFQLYNAYGRDFNQNGSSEAKTPVKDKDETSNTGIALPLSKRIIRGWDDEIILSFLLDYGNHENTCPFFPQSPI
jgi:hypothetical protein